MSVAPLQRLGDRAEGLSARDAGGEKLVQVRHRTGRIAAAGVDDVSGSCEGEGVAWCIGAAEQLPAVELACCPA